MLTRYVLVGWPEIQDYMGHPRYADECFAATSIKSGDDNSYWFVPEDIYNEVEQCGQ